VRLGGCPNVSCNPLSPIRQSAAKPAGDHVQLQLFALCGLYKHRSKSSKRAVLLAIAVAVYLTAKIPCSNILKMRVSVLFHPRVRSALPRPVRRELCSSLLFTRYKTTGTTPQPPKNANAPQKLEYRPINTPRTPQPSSTHAKTALRRGNTRTCEDQ
jgi:hypothetical protein